MKRTTLDWPMLMNAGRELGLAEKALEKWRERRNVPHRWRLPIIRLRKLPLDAIDEFLEGERV